MQELGNGSQLRQPHIDDSEIARAVSLSLKTAEQEKVKREKGDGPGKSKIGGTSIQEDVEKVDQPLVRNRTRHLSSQSVDSVQETEHNPPSSEDNPRNEYLNEWGGISSEEHDEAVMLEAAMSGGIPEGSGYNYAFAPHQFLRPGGFHPRGPPQPPSPLLEAQLLIREQQDDDYLASLQAEQEKELKAQVAAEAHRLQEDAPRESALSEERRIEEESRRQQEEDQELERLLAAKEASLLQEPSSDDEYAITLLVRMLDGNRCGRQFLKFDKLESLFDFIDIGRAVKPGTYRPVRPYPRRAFIPEESTASLDELSLTGKQETLFLEKI